MYPLRVRVESYRYLRNSIAGLILQMRLKEPSLNLLDLTRAISEEAANMGTTGLEFIRAQLRNLNNVTQIQALPEQLPEQLTEQLEQEQSANN